MSSRRFRAPTTGGSRGPIPFIEFKNDQFVVNPRAVEVLSAVRGRLAVVCLAGPYRTGKSYLLNKLVGADSGFRVSGTIDACTKGIWIWGDPVEHDGVSYVFMDSEGLGSLSQSHNFDTQVSTLALLLSSYFVLNTVGTISETALDQLDAVVQCAKQIRVSDNKQQQRPQQQSPQQGSAEWAQEADHLRSLAQYFPHFTWVLRDFVLDLVDREGRRISPDQYLEKALRPVAVPGSASSRLRARLAEKNQVRAVLRGAFMRRSCVPFVRPCADERALRSLSTGTESKVRPEFSEQVDALRAMIFRARPVKTMQGHAVSGMMLCQLAESYVRAINSGKLPVISSAWSAAMASVRQQVELRAYQALDDMMAREFPQGSGSEEQPGGAESAPPDRKLQVFSAQQVAAKSARIRQHVMGMVSQGLGAMAGSPANQQLASKIAARVDKRLAAAAAQNTKIARLRATVIMDRSWDSRGFHRLLDKDEKAITDGGKPIVDYLNAFESRVRGQLTGLPEAVIQAHMYSVFSRKVCVQLIDAFVASRQCLAEAQDTLGQAVRARDRAQEKATALQADLQRAGADATRQLDRLTRERDRASAALDTARSDLKDARGELKETRSELKQALRELKQAASQSERSQADRRAQARAAKREAEKELGELQGRVDVAEALVDQQAADLRSARAQLAESQQECADMRAKVRAAELEAQNLRDEVKRANSGSARHSRGTPAHQQYSSPGSPDWGGSPEAGGVFADTPPSSATTRRSTGRKRGRNGSDVFNNVRGISPEAKSRRDRFYATGVESTPEARPARHSNGRKSSTGGGASPRKRLSLGFGSQFEAEERAWMEKGPKKCTVRELKQWLSNYTDVPQTRMKKADYIALLYDVHPTLSR